MKKLIALKHKLDEMKTMGTNAKKEALSINIWTRSGTTKRSTVVVLSRFIVTRKHRTAAYATHD